MTEEVRRRSTRKRKRTNVAETRIPDDRVWLDEVEDPKSEESKVAIEILEELSTKGYVDTTNTLMPDENEMTSLSRDVEKAIQTLKSKKLHTERTAMNIPVVRAKSLLRIILSSKARKVRIRIRGVLRQCQSYRSLAHSFISLER